mmetsp:Transcript_11111/g.32138  ORF Transcript_11111/g.32138 Transcript_11111/m.32138 type:complete len:137 (+) Transcript_11111:2184-2594(+)
MVCLVAKGKGADCNIVFNSVPHLVSVFQIHTRTTDIVQNVVFNSSVMSTMDDDSTLLRIFNRVPFEETIRTTPHFMKVETVFSFNAALPTFLDTSVRNSGNSAMRLHSMQPHGASGSETRTPASLNRCLFAGDGFG